MKRQSGYAESEAKKSSASAVTRLEWLRHTYASEQHLDAWVVTAASGWSADWQFAVLTILAEEYSVFDAKVDSIATENRGGKPHAISVNFKGTCPFHRYAHSQNRWALINTMGYSTTMFVCHHDRTRKLIQHRLPIPLDAQEKVD